MKDFFKNKQVLVTGAAGFIGSHLADNLINSGATVVGIDNFVTGNKRNLIQNKDKNNFTFIEADVSQSPDQYLPENFKPDVVFHFASPASPPLYQKYPVETYLVNSIGTHNLLQYLLEKNPESRFLFASTSEAYGDPLEHPQKETYWGNVNPNGIRSCYDEAKRMGETICGVHQRDFDMDVRIVRIFNTYGPRMDINDGRVIPNFIKQSLENKPLTVYGDGNQTRSYCYVDDLVQGILLLASKEGLSGQTINLGNPNEMKVLQTAEIVKRKVGVEAEIIHKPLPKDDPTRRRPDISKAKELLNWQPQISFEEGLKKTVEYFKDQSYD